MPENKMRRCVKNIPRFLQHAIHGPKQLPVHVPWLLLLWWLTLSLGRAAFNGKNPSRDLHLIEMNAERRPTHTQARKKFRAKAKHQGGMKKEANKQKRSPKRKSFRHRAASKRNEIRNRRRSRSWGTGSYLWSGIGHRLIVSSFWECLTPCTPCPWSV